MRDMIRAAAEIPGDKVMSGFINNAINEIFQSCTAQSKYPECLTLGAILVPIANGVIDLPDNLQHLDTDEIYFLTGGIDDAQNRLRLRQYGRFRWRDSGPPMQYRLYGGLKTGSSTIYVKKLAITPFADIDIALDTFKINYYGSLTWASDTVTFPIQEMEEYILLRVAARVAKQSNTKLAAKLMGEASIAYNSLRASALAR